MSWGDEHLHGFQIGRQQPAAADSPPLRGPHNSAYSNLVGALEPKRTIPVTGRDTLLFLVFGQSMMLSHPTAETICVDSVPA